MSNFRNRFPQWLVCTATLVVLFAFLAVILRHVFGQPIDVDVLYVTAGFACIVTAKVLGFESKAFLDFMRSRF